MEEKHTKTVDLLLNKATEAFMMAIEIYNKPSIKYRVEGFALFICNAWELMLKAHLIKKNGMDSIYYKDNANRTLSLENCIEKVFTNNKDPLRKNLEKIIELRNTSTHFITEEYEMVYIPLFQACVLNFSEKIEVFHNIDMTSIIPQNFLTLSVDIFLSSSRLFNDSFHYLMWNDGKKQTQILCKVCQSRFKPNAEADFQKRMS